MNRHGLIPIIFILVIVTAILVGIAVEKEKQSNPTEETDR